VLRNVLIGLGLIVVLLVGATVYSRLTDGPPPTPAIKHRQAPKQTVWNGSGQRAVEVAFQRGTKAAITLDHIVFRGLNTNATSLYFYLSTQPGPGGRIPAWLGQKAFSMRFGDNQTVWDPKVRISPPTPTNAIVRVTVSFRKLPTSALAKATDPSASHLSLKIFSPTGSFSVVPVPPAPPLGHEFAEQNTGKYRSGRPYNGKDAYLDHRFEVISAGGRDPLITKRLRKAAARRRAAAARAAAARAAALRAKKKAKGKRTGV
jgi:hypothetical protein